MTDLQAEEMSSRCPTATLQSQWRTTCAPKPAALGRWGSSAWEGSSSRGRKTLTLNLRCLAAISNHGKGFRSKPQANPELESLRQLVVVYNIVLATPATALMPNRNSPAAPLDLSVSWRGGGMLHGQQLALHRTPPRLTSDQHTPQTHNLHTWRGHSSVALGVDTTRGAAVTGYKPSLGWRRAWRQGLLPSVGEIL